MLNKIAAGLIVIIGIVFIVDALLPCKEVNDEIEQMGRRNFSSPDFLVAFKDHPGKCNISQKSYDQLKPGDEVRVCSSRIFKLCVGIDRDGVEVYYKHFWRLIMLLGSFVAIVISLQLIKRKS